MTSSRAADLAAGLQEAAETILGVIGRATPMSWSAVPAPDVWSVGKEAAHVAEAMAYHQWIVRRTIGDKVPSQRPPIERNEMTTDFSPAEIVDLIRTRTAEGVALVGGLSDEQLDLATHPPRANSQTLAVTIERVMIAHIEGHRADAAAKLDALDALQ